MLLVGWNRYKTWAESSISLYHTYLRKNHIIIVLAL